MKHALPFLVIAAALAAGPATQPGRPPADIAAEMRVDQDRLRKAVGDPLNMADPAKRAAMAPAAVPALKRLIADSRELSATLPDRSQNAAFELPLEAACAALGDAETKARFAEQAASTDPATAVRGAVAQVMADYLQVPGDAAGQLRALDRMATLDAAHPDSDVAAQFTALMAGPAASTAVRDRVRQLLGPMTSRAAVAARARLAGPASRP